MFKSKIGILKITEEKEKIQQQLDIINNMQTAEKVNILNEQTSSDVINSQTKTDIHKIQKLSTEEVTAPIQRLKSVSPTNFLEKIYDMWNKEECVRTPWCTQFGEIFQDFFFFLIMR